MKMNEIRVENALPDSCREDCPYFTPCSKIIYGNDNKTTIACVGARCYNSKACKSAAAYSQKK